MHNRKKTVAANKKVDTYFYVENNVVTQISNAQLAKINSSKMKNIKYLYALVYTDGSYPVDLTLKEVKQHLANGKLVKREVTLPSRKDNNLKAYPKKEKMIEEDNSSSPAVPAPKPCLTLFASTAKKPAAERNKEKSKSVSFSSIVDTSLAEFYTFVSEQKQTSKFKI